MGLIDELVALDLPNPHMCEVSGTFGTIPNLFVLDKTHKRMIGSTNRDVYCSTAVTAYASISVLLIIVFFLRICAFNH